MKVKDNVKKCIAILMVFALCVGVMPHTSQEVNAANNQAVAEFFEMKIEENSDGSATLYVYCLDEFSEFSNVDIYYDDSIEIINYGKTGKFEDYEKQMGYIGSLMVGHEEANSRFRLSAAYYVEENQPLLIYHEPIWKLQFKAYETVTFTLEVSGGMKQEIIYEGKAPTPEPTSEVIVEYYFFGDVNMDDYVTAEDALSILKHVVKLETITDEVALFLADLTHDEVIEASDALETLKTVVMLREYEICEVHYY